jgi:signal transduction histidine kinase
VHGDVVGTAMVVTDPDRVGQILTNLLANAFQWATSRVDVRLSENPANATITVNDDGPGFPAPFLPHAFDRFSQASAARGRNGTSGAGLGLAIVAALTHVLGGTVTAGSSELGGAAVTVTLPVDAAE